MTAAAWNTASAIMKSSRHGRFLKIKGPFKGVIERLCRDMICSSGFPKLGVLFWNPHKKDYSILGSLILGNYHIQTGKTWLKFSGWRVGGSVGCRAFLT